MRGLSGELIASLGSWELPKRSKRSGVRVPPGKQNSMKNFLKFLLVWISQNLAIPFWVVGHIHLSIHNFHDMVEIVSSIGMNVLVAIGFCIDYYENGR